jgi:hypothetical protein
MEGKMESKRIYGGLLFFIALFLVVPQLTSQEEAAEKSKLEVRCFKNIEVFCTLISLTDYWEKRPCKLPFISSAGVYLIKYPFTYVGNIFIHQEKFGISYRVLGVVVESND